MLYTFSSLLLKYMCVMQLKFTKTNRGRAPGAPVLDLVLDLPLTSVFMVVSEESVTVTSVVKHQFGCGPVTSFTCHVCRDRDLNIRPPACEGIVPKLQQPN